LSKYPEEAAQTKRLAVFHDFGIRRISEFFGFPACVFQFAEAIDQLVFERVLSRKDSPVGNRIAQKVCRKISFFRNDAEKFVISLHDKALYELAFLRCDGSCAVYHDFELAAFENHVIESAYVKQLH